MNQNALHKYFCRQWRTTITYTSLLTQVGRASILATLLPGCCFTALAQGNYVANSANNTSLTGDRNTVTGYNSGF